MINDLVVVSIDNTVVITIIVSCRKKKNDIIDIPESDESPRVSLVCDELPL